MVVETCNTNMQKPGARGLDVQKQLGKIFFKDKIT